MTTRDLAALKMNYTLKISGLSGNVTSRPNALDYNKNAKFSTIDADNDQNGKNCVSSYVGGGWWYKSCSYVYLNDPYTFVKTPYKEIGWNHVLNQNLLK